MKTIKDLTVKVTYSAGIGDAEVSDEVMNGLEKIQDEYHGEISADIGTTTDDDEILAAFEWLTNNIKEADAFDWNYEIVDLE